MKKKKASLTLIQGTGTPEITKTPQPVEDLRCEPACHSYDQIHHDGLHVVMFCIQCGDVVRVTL